VRPETPEDVATVLAAADRDGAAVVPWGGGEHMVLGMPPARYDLALDLRSLDRIVEYEPADLTVTVEAGMKLSSLQALLGERGQWLPLDPPGSAAMTVGGVIAANASGPARIAYGTARDLLIGIGVATPGGELVKSGGRVVKNVAGYDLGKLHIGALGTLGVIVRASFKVAPRPQTAMTLQSVSHNLGELLAVVNDARSRGLALNGLAVTREASSDAWTLLVRLAGGAAAVGRSRHQLPSLDEVEPGIWQELPAFEASAVRVKASVLPSELSRVCTGLSELNAAVVAYPGVGIVYGAWREPSVTVAQLRDLRRLCVEAGRGALVIEQGPVELRREAGVWGETGANFAIMQRLKAELDPKDTLSPGRFFGGI
jgi:glycolate oxidase FAD binding subunit